MSTVSYTMLTNQNELNFTGENIRADAYYGNTDGLHTVSIKVNDFVGRIYIEGTLSSSPTDVDWFPIYLTSGTPYRQYPFNSASPTGNVGDTGTTGYSFRANVIYLRARVDREYLGDSAYDVASHGTVEKILLNV